MITTTPTISSCSNGNNHFVIVMATCVGDGVVIITTSASGAVDISDCHSIKHVVILVSSTVRMFGCCY